MTETETQTEIWRSEDGSATATTDAATAARVLEHVRVQRAYGTAPHQAYPVPAPDQFEGAEFLPAPDLAEIAQHLLAQHGAHFGAIGRCNLQFLWRAKGGVTKGSPTLGRCTKAAGLVQHYSAADAIIWAAADHARKLQLTARQVEALVYHELSHLFYDSESGSLRVLDHDFAGFCGELEHYGPWTAALRQAVTTVRQLPLWSDEAEDGEDEDEPDEAEVR